MMNYSPENEIRKIYQKSVYLLNDRHTQLAIIRQVLKKAVLRLTVVAQGKSPQINSVLTEIHRSVEDKINIDRLDHQLDKLSVLLNQAGNGDCSVIQKSNQNAESHNSHILSDSQILSEVIKQLTLPSILEKEQIKIAGILDQPHVSERSGNDTVQRMVSLINNSIAYLQENKNELLTCLNNASLKLTDVEMYLHDLYLESEQEKTRSIRLIESLENDISTIDQVVASSDGITQLKQSVTLSLQNIHQCIAQHKKADHDKEKISRQSFASIIKQLSATRNESEKLKVE